ncbi:DeoR/GlpR family transcriptional regulator [Endozoicomonas elysicola]|uniref:Transcriptional regulator n=1 Tax=Endozoicomonas elysicola TaxID=305900 RepID=A0A081K6R8_9GAMM|nr:DeoR/GlpR family transcriptional regulator [Endozoicomonas elysicola]KEI69844.1 transcriptional regulator [Endozoicomonas elysicola]
MEAQKTTQLLQTQQQVPQSQRHEMIITLIKQEGFVTTEGLVQHFNVTPQTIRRDLNELDLQGKITRHHGGAGLPNSSIENTQYSERKHHLSAEKDRIAIELVKYIPNNSSLFIDIGTSTESVARALVNHRNLKVVTNNLHVASILLAREDFTVIIAGGEVRNRDGGIIGEATRDFISQFRMDFAITGISGIDMDGTLLDFDYHEVRVAQAMMSNARKTLTIADHSKFGRSAMIRLGHVADIDTLFTDAQPPLPLMEQLKLGQTKVVVC